MTRGAGPPRHLEPRAQTPGPRGFDVDALARIGGSARSPASSPRPMSRSSSPSSANRDSGHRIRTGPARTGGRRAGRGPRPAGAQGSVQSRPTDILPGRCHEQTPRSGSRRSPSERASAFNTTQAPRRRLFIGDTMGGGSASSISTTTAGSTFTLSMVVPCPSTGNLRLGQTSCITTAAAGPSRRHRARRSRRARLRMRCAVGDFDNDGHDDLFVTGLDQTILYRNRGNGTSRKSRHRPASPHRAGQPPRVSATWMGTATSTWWLSPTSRPSTRRASNVAISSAS